MFDYIKKSLLTGVGLALKSKTEIEELARELASKSKMNQEEAQKLIDDLQDRYEETREKLDRRIEDKVTRVLQKFDIPDRSDIRALSDRIDQLSEKISGMGK